MPSRFPIEPDSPRPVHLAASLMEAMSASISPWLMQMVLQEETANDVANAAALAFAIELSLIADMTAKSDRESRIRFIDSLTKRIADHMKQNLDSPRYVPPTPAGPDESIN